MKTEKHPIIIFVILVALMALLFEWIYDIMTGLESEDMLERLLLDLPFVMIMSLVSFLIVHSTNKYFRYKDNVYIRVSFELFVAVSFAVIYSLSVKYFLAPLIDEGCEPTYLESAIMVALGNFFIVLLL